MQNKKMDLKQTQIAIKTVKDYFQNNLSKALNLTRVSAPLFVRPETGLNDNLSGIEKPVSFDLGDSNIHLEIVQSLAKWKRFALLRYGFKLNEGLYTDMNAIRADEKLDEVHSIYVDQWDWEKIISAENRNEEYLYSIVNKIYDVFKNTEKMINEKYEGYFSQKLPDEIYFIKSQELLDMYPDLNSKEREKAICKEKKAVFIQGIGGKLSNGASHDDRSPDYDDWSLNGDILFWNPVMNDAIELSSMGIRVNKNSLLNQLKISGKEDRLEQSYHKDLIGEKLPLTIGGGIGQSRICMYMLEKRHIGEVQSSVWDEKNIKKCEELGIELL
ncbi:aspartate-ammonia ligase [Peptoanaerobacter stomatis]|uniref:Aspartate--ammonia ligase n=1 Tax=Peptoanaerobacter stomatis TaxID=796937 RepID=G9X358_9FIRM|nr:aspartate--ammonia ligase [Peptoanaerobacter stomatis]EHL10600.1 aspartate-ammonia ligase [Peptoanaerobacter stomatis]